MDTTKSDHLILVVENDESMGRVLRTAFEDEGYRVHLASRAPTASEVEDLHPDLLMLDVAPSHTSAAWDLVQEIKSTPRVAGTPIVVCSGGGAFVAAEDVRVRSEAAAILAKPFALDVLLPVVATALDRRDRFAAIEELVAEPAVTRELGSIGF